MTEIIGKIETLVMIYAPVVFVYLMQIIGFIQNAIRLKKMNVKGDVAEVIKPLDKRIKILIDQIEQILIEAEDLKHTNKVLMDENMNLKREYKKLSASINKRIEEQNEILNSLVKKNVEWEAKARIAEKKLKEK